MNMQATVQFVMPGYDPASMPARPAEGWIADQVRNDSRAKVAP
jgi:hypothetical protein